MKNQTLILLIIAGACGLVAMMGVKQYLDKQNQTEETPKVKVLVAQAPIKQGERLTELNTQFTSVDAGSCPEGVVTDLEQILERSSKVPRGAGDWILIEQLTERGQTGATAGIPTGMRVATIAVDATTNHSGMLQPGNRIDLFLSYRERDVQSGAQLQKIVPLLEYIEVFAVDNVQYGVDTGGENMQARNISLLVDAGQSMKLQLAKKKGDISTVLRSSADKDAIEITSMEESSLTGGGPKKIDERSTMDTQIDQFRLPDLDTTMFSMLQPEVESRPTASGPVKPQLENEKDENTWIMVIYEAGNARIEHVDLTTELPVIKTPEVLVPVTPESEDNADEVLEIEDLLPGEGFEDASELLKLLN